MAYGTHVTVIDKIDTEPVKLRVAAYARVSSDSEDQLNSYIAQVDFYTKYITTHEGWELVDIYADEGLTGMETRHRDDFNRMIQDCRDGKIDRVLVKSVSRFARNTQEYILYMRELLRLGITIYFEKENLNTGKMSNEQAAAIYGAFAQMETTGHSQNMRVSNRIRMEKGLYILQQAPFGYKMVDGELVIIPEEAEVVREIYKAYLSGQGKQDIAKALNVRGITKGVGNGQWCMSGIDYILSNITYTGNQIWQKSFSADVIPFKKVPNRGEKPKYYVEDCCPAIISQEEFDLAQALTQKRLESKSPRTDVDSPFKGHIFCSECGYSCRAKNIRGKRYWMCRGRNIGKELCPVPQVSDEDIAKAIERFCLKLRHARGTILAPSLKMLRELQERELRTNSKISEIDAELSRLTERNRVLATLKAKGYMDPALFLSEQNEVNSKAWGLRKLRRDIIDRTHNNKPIQQTEMMLEYLASLPDTAATSAPDIFTMLIDRILLAPNGEIQIKAINGMVFTESTGKAVTK